MIIRIKENNTKFKGDTLMPGIAYLTMTLGFIKTVLEICLYMEAITLSFKGVRALNIYINKNSN